MAWLYKQGGSDNWYIGYRLNGKLKAKTTKTSDRAKAEAELLKVETTLNLSRAGTLTEDLFHSIFGKGQSKITLAAELEGWLLECQGSTSEKTYARYEAFAKEFRTALNATDTAPLLSQVTTDDVRQFLNTKRANTSAGTANLARKTLSAIFIRAVKNHHLRENPVSPIKPFKATKGEKVNRRAYTLAELEGVYAKAPSDFWRYMILGEFYTGLRMGDLICLTWGHVDLAKGFISIEPDKTDGKTIHIPIAKAFFEILNKLKSKTAKPSDYLWPDQAARYQEKGSGVFSNEFYKKILTPCGLVTTRSKSHTATGNGHTGKRQLNELSFHSLRHSFVSFLRSTGSNQAIAKELAGHASDAVNALYTHIPEDVLSKAVNQLPEFVK